VSAIAWPQWPGLLGAAPRFRYLWLSRSISATGTGVARVALVLLVAPSGPAAVSAVLLGTALPQLLGPAAGAIADRVDQRRLLAGCEAGQGTVYLVIAVDRPPLPELLVLVTVAALLATAMSPAGRSSITRLVPDGRLPQANALIGLALNLPLVAGPALGGLLAGLAGVTPAFALNAGSFFASALLLTRLGPLPPPTVSTRDGIMAETRAGLHYVAHHRLVRGLALGMLVFVSFAAADNVTLVFLIRNSLHGSDLGYGVANAAFGVGMAVASVALAIGASRRPATFWLISGVVAGAIGMAVTGMAPVLALACAGQALAGSGNTAELVGTDTLIQQSVAPALLSRAFGVVYSAAQLGSVIAYLAASALVAFTNPRVAFLVASAGMVAGLLVLGPTLGGAKPSRRGP
jgi:MFS family permease